MPVTPITPGYNNQKCLWILPDFLQGLKITHFEYQTTALNARAHTRMHTHTHTHTQNCIHFMSSVLCYHYVPYLSITKTLGGSYCQPPRIHRKCIHWYPKLTDE